MHILFIRLRQIPLEGEEDSFSRDTQEEISPTLQVGSLVD